jgi:hypothetical protein
MHSKTQLLSFTSPHVSGLEKNDKGGEMKSATVIFIAEFTP